MSRIRSPKLKYYVEPDDSSGLISAFFDTFVEADNFANRYKKYGMTIYAFVPIVKFEEGTGKEESLLK